MCCSQNQFDSIDDPVSATGGLKKRADDSSCGRLARVSADNLRGRCGAVLCTVARTVTLTQQSQCGHGYAVEFVLVVRLLPKAHCQRDLPGEYKRATRKLPRSFKEVLVTWFVSLQVETARKVFNAFKKRAGDVVVRSPEDEDKHAPSRVTK